MKHKTLFSLLTLVLLGLLLAACGGADQPTPVPPAATPVPPAATPAPDQPAAAEAAWQRIQASGTLVVGTSADYPPFEYYDENFRITGFDIALIDEIAARLGVQVDVRDMAFDGLVDALHLGQIDVAIAAISVTPEREAQVDFGQIYFVSQDAYLANPGSAVGQIDALEDLIPYRVGVQRASVFQDWLEDELITTGLMPATDLFVYGQIEEGFADLQENRVDLLIMDRQPAQVAVDEQGFRLAGEGLNRERYAIALARGENTLRTRLNQALTTLQDEGIVADLAKQYLDLDPEHILPVPTATPVPPTATPAPQQPTATPIPGCRDGAAYVADLNLDDQNMQNPPIIDAGQPFRKTWRIRNTGACAWDGNYSLNFVQGNQPGAQMGGQPEAIQGTVQPGQTYDISVDLVAPLRPGTYQGFWQMTNGQGRAFGERVYVGIRVPSGPTPTPAATQTPSPGITFRADSTNIRQGECTTVYWDARNVKAVYFYAQGQNWENNGVAGTANRQVCPNQTTTYYLRVVKNDNSVETRQLTINVQPGGNPPTIARFTVDPAGQVPAGACVTLRWDVQGNVDRVKLTRNNTAIWDGAPFRGNYQDCPPGAGDMAYAIEASGPGGANRAVQHVTLVEGQPTATPQPTGVPQPVIDAFSVDPGQIGVGQCVNIAWSTSSGTNHVRLLRDGNVVQDNAGLSGQVQDCLNQAGRVTYRLEASNTAGVSVTQDAGVDVAAPQPTATPVPPQAPVINFFAADPAQIAAGQCVNLSWSFTGQDLAAVAITRNGEQIAADVAPDGSQQDCPPGEGGVTYTLKVDAEFGGSAQQSAQVQIVAPVQPTVAPQPEPPTITSFGANPPQIDLNNTCTTLEWSFTGEGIAAVTLSRNGQPIGGPDVASPYQDCVDPGLAGQDLIYELKVDSEFGGSTSQQALVAFIAG